MPSIFFRDVQTNVHRNNETLSSNTYNIFKTAINRGTELIKSTFLSKNTNLCSTDLISSNVYQTKEQGNETENSSSSESSSSESECSSPDSIQTELMYFKPIAREARTPSSNDTKILRLPSVRSTSSGSTVQTPCPSPFFIPITSQRQSAFSFVSHILTDKNQVDTLKKPKSMKRRNSTSENKKSDQSPKRKRSDKKKDTDIKDSSNRNTKCKTETLTRGTKTRQLSKVQENKAPVVVAKPPQKRPTKKASVLDDTESDKFRRVTRSMKK